MAGRTPVVLNTAELLTGRCRVIGITLIRSPFHQNPGARATCRALGLNKRHAIVYHKNIAPIRGMINRIRHMVDVMPVKEPETFIPYHKYAAQAPTQP
eukprot:TRINITY_DN4287_c0_g1_i1.p1 TRINITY_DN4287_c0_g1~~TRINITY_DN4287_c0_g1_i1.p1  ORF type:complete len:112 (-),score=14.23 TRINITY_DN4287_c0_g1_i1:47-340(-)